MKTIFAFALLFFVTTIGCSSNDVTPQNNFVKAKIMRVSCGGIVIQLIQPTDSIGRDWLWSKNLNDPFSTPNSSQVYPNCVTAFGIPKDQQTVEKLIEITYNRIKYPPGTICNIGGLPVSYISVTDINP